MPPGAASACAPHRRRRPSRCCRLRGRPIIEWTIERLARAGIVDLVVNHAHLGHLIEAALGDGRRLGVSIRYSAEAEALETAGGIANALHLLGADPFLAVNGDIYCDFDFASLRVRPLGPSLAHLVLVANPAHHPQGDFALCGAQVRDDGAPRWTFSGIGLYRPELFASVRPGDKAKLAPLLRAAMARGLVTGEITAGNGTTSARPNARSSRTEASARAVLDRGAKAADNPLSPSASGNPMIDLARCAERRATLARRMDTGIAIMPTAPERIRNRDSDYLYRFDSYFYYLTGFPEPEAVLVVVAGTPSPNRSCSAGTGTRSASSGTDSATAPRRPRKLSRIDETASIATLEEAMPKLIANQRALFYAPGADPGWDARVMNWLNQVRAQSRTGVTAPNEIRDVRAILDEMRLFKDETELATMRRAAAISAVAHRRAMRATRPGRNEFEIEAELLYEFRRAGAQFPAYWPIVAGGRNACVLHYRDNHAPLAEGDLLLIDAGCELDGYAADITRTFPVDGRFSAAQRDIYELVLAAQAAADRQGCPRQPLE